MDDEELFEIEVRLFLDALWLRYGYDFREYADASLRRRVKSLTTALQVERVADLIPLLLRDEGLLPKVVNRLPVVVTEFFREPDGFSTVVKSVIPLLASYPRVNIWLAGCATGEEVYSLAILLEEAGIYEQCQLYATDLSEEALACAETGIYPEESLEAAEGRYRLAGGRHSLRDHFSVRYAYARVRERLRKNVFFAQHNLATDGVFCEAHLVVCRNVLIYFNHRLQDRVIQLFADALVRGGFLWLGDKESLELSSLRPWFTPIPPSLFRYQPLGSPVT